MTGEETTPQVSVAHIDMRWIVAGGDVIGQMINLPRPLPTALFSLPSPPARLVGRVMELKTLLTELAPAPDDDTDTDASSAGNASSGVVVSVLAGMGGVGKTALALAAGAIAQHKEWFCAQLYVDLRGYTPGTKALSAEAALDVLLRQMGVDAQEIPPEASERASYYRSVLAKLSQADERNRPVLVVADNAHSAAQARPLLPGTGEHRLLATTRGGLHSLLGALHLDLDVLDSADSLSLLVFALKAVDPQDTRADDAVELGMLSELCGHLPLALEIAGAQLARKPRLSPRTLSERLEKAVSRVDKLKDHGPHAERTRALRAVFNTSLDQLTPEEVRVFLLVAAAPGPATSTAAAAAAVLTGLVADEVQELLEELQAAHLLTQPVQGRWGAHDLLTDHATTHPCPPSDRDQAIARLLDHYTDAARGAHAYLRALPEDQVPDVFPDREAALGWLGAERPTLVAAALAAPALRHNKGAVLLPLFLAEYLAGKRLLEEGEQVSRSAQRTAHVLGFQAHEAAAWNNLGILLQEMGRFEDAVEAHTRARDLHQLLGNASGAAAAWDNLGSALSGVGEFGVAIDAHTRAREVYHRIGDIHGEARSWGNLGNTLRKAGREEEMIQAYTLSGDLHRQAGGAHGEAKARKNLGFVLLNSGRPGQAVEEFTEAVVLFETAGDEDRASGVRDLIAQTRADIGSDEQA